MSSIGLLVERMRNSLGLRTWVSAGPMSIAASKRLARRTTGGTRRSQQMLLRFSGWPASRRWLAA